MRKFYFSYYLITYMIDAKQNLIYDYVEKKRIYYFCANDSTLHWRSPKNMDSLLNKESNWYIVNGHKPSCSTNILSKDCSYLYISTIKFWHSGKASFCWEIFFVELVLREIDQMFKKVGLNPKYLLDKAKYIKLVQDRRVNIQLWPERMFWVIYLLYYLGPFIDNPLNMLLNKACCIRVWKV